MSISPVSERSSGRRDHGQAVMLMLSIVALIGLLTVGVAKVGALLVEQSRARTAADAAALAGVSGGPAIAAAVAAADGATLLSFRREEADVVVVVRVGHTHARARATAGP